MSRHVGRYWTQGALTIPPSNLAFSQCILPNPRRDDDHHYHGHGCDYDEGIGPVVGGLRHLAFYTMHFPSPDDVTIRSNAI